MPTQHDQVRVTGFVCGPRIYSFEGWLFEWHSYCGPWPLRKDGEPRARAGRCFWQMVERFQGLPDTEQAKYRIGGGCIPLLEKGQTDHGEQLDNQN